MPWFAEAKKHSNAVEQKYSFGVEPYYYNKITVVGLNTW
jgi:hypothetical protein